jgi:hypothetical protein
MRCLRLTSRLVVAKQDGQAKALAPPPRVPACAALVKEGGDAGDEVGGLALAHGSLGGWLRRAYEPGEATAVGDRSLTARGSSVLGAGRALGWVGQSYSTTGGGGIDLRGLGSHGYVRAEAHETFSLGKCQCRAFNFH